MQKFWDNSQITSARSPWSNGLVEHYNLILSDIPDIILQENKWDFDLTLAWAINAKNSIMTNDFHITKYQLATTQN